MKETNTAALDPSYCHISMSEEDAALFYQMRKYQDIWQTAFSKLRPGSLILHFDNKGEIKKHEFHFYQR